MATNHAIRDDRVMPAMRWVALGIFVILVPAVIILWGAPGQTDDLWAWTIEPALTPIFLGSGYGAGAYFFWRTFRATRWHPSSAGVVSAATFAAVMLVATLLHWDKFNHGDAPTLAAIAFYGWVIVYIISPQTMIDLWPWKLTPLTARVLASFTFQVGVGAMLLSLDTRWSTWRLLIQTFFVATAFLLVGAIRAFDDFDTDNVMTWLYLGGLIGADLVLFGLYRTYNGLAGAARTT